MNIFLVNILIPLVIGVITPFVVDWIRTKLQKRDSLSTKERYSIGISVALVIALILIFLPPYKVSSINWCQDTNQNTVVSGRLTKNLLGTPAKDCELQVKIFPIGSDSPIFPEEFSRTSAEGMFSVTFPQIPGPSSDKGYLINSAYKFRILSIWERWETKDFRMGDITECPAP